MGQKYEVVFAKGLISDELYYQYSGIQWTLLTSQSYCENFVT